MLRTLTFVFLLAASLESARAGEALSPHAASAQARFLERFPGAEILKVKERLSSDLNLMNFITASQPRRQRITCEIRGRDPHNQSIKVDYASDGELLKVDGAKVPFERLPAVVRKVAEKLRPGTKWDALARLYKYEKTPLFWELTGRDGKKKVELSLTDDGHEWDGD